MIDPAELPHADPDMATSSSPGNLALEEAECCVTQDRKELTADLPAAGATCSSLNKELEDSR